VTEIPEHLLKRSKERRAAIGGEGAAEESAAPSGEAVEAAPAAAAPVAAAAAVEVAPEPPKPERPEVVAARSRKKVPFWAIPVLVALPVWAYVYHGTLEPPPAGESDPLVLGEQVYGGCASCHGSSGGGGSGPALTGVLDTWKDPFDHMMWVRIGSAGWSEYSATYGDNKKPVGGGGMPAHADLSDQELAQVVLYERAAFGKLDPTSDEYVLLASIADGTVTMDQAIEQHGEGALSKALGIPATDLSTS
jgi:mono/diheme cytochrome c family protein